ncbi:hypothetical protein N185_36075 [Sinorhizobium sp. GW3]|nr:hypothetical protein N185_36075 [Sinorhizobium sp. GW3]
MCRLKKTFMRGWPIQQAHLVEIAESGFRTKAHLSTVFKRIVARRHGAGWSFQRATDRRTGLKRGMTPVLQDDLESTAA